MLKGEGLRLEPCAHCGGSARIRDYKDVKFLIHNADCFMVQCDTCGCGTSYEATEEQAVAAWNRRAVEQPKEAAP